MVLIDKISLRRLAEKSEKFFRSPLGNRLVLVVCPYGMWTLGLEGLSIPVHWKQDLQDWLKCMVRGQLCYEGSFLSESLRLLYGLLSRFETTISMVSASVLGRLFRHCRRKTETTLFESCIVQFWKSRLLVIEVKQLIRVLQPRPSTAVLQSRDIREVDEELGEVTRRRRRGTDCLRPVRERARFLVGARARLYGTTCSTARRQFAQSSRSGSARASLVGKQQIADGRKTCVTTVSEK